LQLNRSRDALLRPLLVVIGAAIVFGSAAAAITVLVPRTYEANTTLLIGRSTTGSDPEYQDLLASQLLAQTYAELASTRPILSAVARELDLNQTPQQLADSISVQASGLNPTVQITVRGPDPDGLAAIANEVARQLIAWKPTDGSTDGQPLSQLTQTLSTLDAEIARAQAEADQRPAPGSSAEPGAQQASLGRLASLLATRTSLLQLIANTSSTSVLVIEPADPPTEPARSNVLLNVAAAMLLGVLLAAGVLFAATETRASGRLSTER
jgi:capsular polysaccharide biosynthesis protein